jgi:hypothetical protein
VFGRPGAGLVAGLLDRRPGLVVLVPDLVRPPAQHPLLELVDRLLGMGLLVGLVALVIPGRPFLIRHVRLIPW